MILASNHRSFVDSIVIPCIVPRKVVFLAKSDYFTGTGIKGAAQRAWFEGIGMLPVDREDTKAALPASTPRWRCSDAARRSGSTPRGPARATAGSTAAAPASPTSRSPPGARSSRSGCSAPRTSSPSAPTGRGWRDVTARFGAPLDFTSRFAGVPLGPARREVTDEIMAAIQALTDQEPAASTTTAPVEA